jgi:hypothetical protein
MINEPKEDPTSMEHIGSRGRQKIRKIPDVMSPTLRIKEPSCELLLAYSSLGHQGTLLIGNDSEL